MNMQKYNLKINKKQEKQSGITLVALVITVIVMLILAGVAIAAVVDEEGLFSKTREATEVYENVADKESETLTNLMGQIDHYLNENKDNGNESTENKPIVNPINQIVQVNQTYSGGTTGSYNDPIIPKGFAPINENGADWGTEEGYKSGLVITDKVTDGESIGNEFVWVPVDGTNVIFARQDWKNKEGELLTWPENTTIGTDTDTQYVETVPSEITQSITINGGFYIARFEAGKPQEGDLITDGTIKPVSRQGATVWNNIAWSDTGISDDINPGNGAVTVARNMYSINDTNYGVASTLIYGTQWDTALNFIGAYNVNESNYVTYATDSTGMGNYNGTIDDTIDELATCGADLSFSQKNIYDMAGNVWEYTMEKYSFNRVSRGGSYSHSGLERPASYRGNDSVNNENGYGRFPCRPLYKVGAVITIF